MLIPLCNPKMSAGQFPHAVVSYSPAGTGKITLAKKLVLDQLQDNLIKTFNSTFYLSCKELSHNGSCTFVEWFSKN